MKPSPGAIPGASPLQEASGRWPEGLAWCPRRESHLTYMIDIALTTEFTLVAGGAR
jgi:hypothetical protein